ncbi:hypothetical protein [Lactiplantibacillus herbarum]|uniref:hypothetical protein n=1 Tax=Lactiplantibacillus herbarum TaxID=1670446 RepID=UPI00064FBA16|nr:hypothetical protein [Lactiplantibacillus herbarum]
MFSIKNVHGHYSLLRQTGLAAIPMLLAIIAYPLLPARVYVPTALASLEPWGIKGNIFIYPVFCLILWFFIWLFVFFNRLYEKNLKVNRQEYNPLESYYIWGSWILDGLATVMVLIQIIVSVTH